MVKTDEEIIRYCSVSVGRDRALRVCIDLCSKREQERVEELYNFLDKEIIFFSKPETELNKALVQYMKGLKERIKSEVFGK